MEDSILSSIKELLGIQKDFEEFDSQVIVCINSAFSMLTQLGVGPKKGFHIRSDNEIWCDFMKELPANMYSEIKNYVHLKTQMLFDPPTSSILLQAKNNLLSEIEWRLHIEADTDRIGG